MRDLLLLDSMLQHHKLLYVKRDDAMQPDGKQEKMT